MLHVRALVIGSVAMSCIANVDNCMNIDVLTAGSDCSGTALRFLSSDATSAKTADRTPAKATAERNMSIVTFNDQFDSEAWGCYHF